jgi:hypothetical protein
MPPKRPRKTTTRLFVTVPVEVEVKINHLMKLERLDSQSAMTKRLIQEALEKYPDPDQPDLPLT